jgi:hypothetical protein
MLHAAPSKRLLGGSIVMRKALLIVALAGLACGSRETTTTDTGATTTETPAVSAVQPPAEGNLPDDTAAVEPVEVTTCVELVEAGKNAEAVVACQTAVELYPENTKAATALAKAGGSNMIEGAAGAASAAAGAAVEGVKDAASATGEAVKDAANATTEAAKDAADARTNEAAKDAAEDAADAVQ